jgi:hypothetical protein
MKIPVFNKIAFAVFLVFCLLLVNCKKEKTEPFEVKFPVKFMLTKKYQDWFRLMNSHDTLIFINQNSDTIYMKTDGMSENLFFSQYEVRQGQQLSNYYTCQSEYLKTFKIGYQLYAINDSSANLMLVTILGYLMNNQRTKNYTYSSAELFLKPVKDSFSVEKANSRLRYLDSVTLQNKLFYSSYYIDSSQNLANGYLSNHYYFNLKSGFIAFNTWDGKEWVRIK